MKPSALLITDFDGTMTETDFYKIALDRFTPSETRYVWERFKRKELTQFETLQGIFSAIDAPQKDIVAALADMQLDPGAKAAIDRLRAADWDVVITSGGCEWYIERVLQGAGIEVTVHANPGGFAESGGLEMRLPSESRFLSDQHGIDKEKVVREALDNYPRVAFAGNSEPDLAAARLVSGDFRFARSELAKLLDQERLPYHRYEHWSDIATMLVP
jgi:2,3-diketo-5-methylthio-1-phosphopentane phosphatase